jgi:hypothetical protein
MLLDVGPDGLIQQIPVSSPRDEFLSDGIQRNTMAPPASPKKA